MKKILIILAAILCAIACSNDTNTIYQFSAESNSGDQVNFADYKGKVLLIVNTAKADSTWIPDCISCPRSNGSVGVDNDSGLGSLGTLVGSNGICALWHR